jgi:hypothetical protein
LLILQLGAYLRSGLLLTGLRRRESTDSVNNFFSNQEKLMTSINENQPVESHKAIQAVLTLNGMKRGKDFILKRNQLRIFQSSIRDKVLSIIQRACPGCSFYWETPKVLRWF